MSKATRNAEHARKLMNAAIRAGKSDATIESYRQLMLYWAQRR